MLCPQPLLRHEMSPDAFGEFLHTLQASQRTSWQSLSVCRHPFEINDFDRVSRLQVVPELTYHHLKLHNLSLPTVQSLKLPLTQSLAIIPGLRPNEFSSPTLHDLELGYSGHLCRLHTFSKQQYSRTGASYGLQLPHTTFRKHLIPVETGTCNFPCLRSLTLRGFVFDVSGLHDLRLVYSETLRTLHLIDCWCIDTHQEFVRMAHESLSSTLKLSGVEMYRLRFLHPTYEPVFDWTGAPSQFHPVRDLPAEAVDEYTEEYAAKMRDKRRLDYEFCKEKGREGELPKYNVRNWPCERPELEAVFLGGRENGVVRKANAKVDQEAMESWSHTPVRCY